MQTALPADFDAELSEINQFGILDEDPDTIQSRLALAVKDIAESQGGTDLGLGDWVVWAKNSIHELTNSIHKGLCDPNGGGLKEEYKDMVKSALTPEGVSAISGVIINIVAQFNPAFAVSNVVIYVSIWLLKVGINCWCTMKIE